MALPDRVATELFAHELLDQDLPDGFQSGVGKEQLDRTGSVAGLDSQSDVDGGTADAGNRCSAWVRLQPLTFERDAAEREEARREIVEQAVEQLLDEVTLD